VIKALITGGAGFLGFALGGHLHDRGAEVHLLDDFSRGSRDPALERFATRPRARVLTGDLRDPASLASLDRDYTHVYHMAAIIGVANVLQRPDAVLRENVAMHSHALDFAHSQARLQRFLFPSTSEVYAGTLRYFDLAIPTPESVPLAITDLSEARTSYMLSKIYGEAMCHHSGLPFTIIRPHNVYGPRMGLQHVVPELMQRAYRAETGGVLQVFSVDHTRTFCYVDDAVELTRRLTEAPAGLGGTFNVGTATRELTIREVAETILRVVGKPLTILPGPTTAGSPSRRAPDMTHAVEASGFAPAIEFEDGIRRTFDWYRREVFDAATAPGAVRPGGGA